MFIIFRFKNHINSLYQFPFLRICFYTQFWPGINSVILSGKTRASPRILSSSFIGSGRAMEFPLISKRSAVKQILVIYTLFSEYSYLNAKSTAITVLYIYYFRIDSVSYLAIFTALVSRITVTFTCPG